MNRNWILIALALVAVAVVGRLLPHAANITPLYAVALFACATLPRRWALAVPVAAMVGSDLIIGMHGSVMFTWTGMLAFAALGYGMRGRASTGRILMSAVAGSVVFFVWTNLGVWMTSYMYPRTADGLVTCYVAALPFFRNSLLGTVAFAGAIFAAYEWLRLRQHARSAAVVQAHQAVS